VLVALVGNPNCGKTAVFNRLTGAREKVGNYAGVTVERKAGALTTSSGRAVQVLDLPGTYSFRTLSVDEAVARDVCLGERPGEGLPDLLICVVDATNLRLNLRFALEVRDLGRPMVVALNQMDAAARRGITIDVDRLAAGLGVPVIPTVAIRRGGVDELVRRFDEALPAAPPRRTVERAALHDEVRALLDLAVTVPRRTSELDDRIDRWVLHPVFGLVLLAVTLFLTFQAVYVGAAPFMDGLEAGVGWVGERVGAGMADGPLRDLLVEGVIAGVGSVVVFLPQILILFAFILVLEESGYLPRAAFLLDRFMAGAGLTGRSFIPLLSSFACAVPGIMATRSIRDPWERLAAILVAPLMTCSARLPVYALLIGAFIPDHRLAGFVSLQGLVLFGLYAAAVASAMAVAFTMSGCGARTSSPRSCSSCRATTAPIRRRSCSGCGSGPRSSCVGWARSCCRSACSCGSSRRSRGRRPVRSSRRSRRRTPVVSGPCCTHCSSRSGSPGRSSSRWSPASRRAR
jgi:ferrous iron transport protein B